MEAKKVERKFLIGSAIDHPADWLGDYLTERDNELTRSVKVRRETLRKMNRFGRRRQSDKTIQGTVLEAKCDFAGPLRLCKDSTERDGWTMTKKQGEGCKLLHVHWRRPGNVSGANRKRMQKAQRLFAGEAWVGRLYAIHEMPGQATVTVKSALLRAVFRMTQKMFPWHGH